MSATTSGMALTEDDLSPAQEQSLELLREGRVTAPFVAEQADYSLQYIREELTDLVKHGHVSKIHDGLYELVNDPRVETDRRPKSEADIDHVREFIHGIEEQIRKAERGEIDRNVEKLRQQRDAIAEVLEEDEQAHAILEEDDAQ
ncbi:hypothetical protein ACODNH_05435 [Haloarcula sp. NS06]|uniref:hypothetical protein n=1 Tax=Haloarcula sp. NS06 TaxID=3409688 RepID=UPI003DA75845